MKFINKLLNIFLFTIFLTVISFVATFFLTIFMQEKVILAFEFFKNIFI